MMLYKNILEDFFNLVESYSFLCSPYQINILGRKTLIRSLNPYEVVQEIYG
ncbi:hypothetical protein NIES2109_61100 (plasmid) [Nostoc sp. HK-01]|nr:hypothetical protein NIES2109_61100 [Nostoc sp. HK-01]